MKWEERNTYKDLRMVGIRNWFSVMVFLYFSQNKKKPLKQLNYLTDF